MSNFEEIPGFRENCELRTNTFRQIAAIFLYVTRVKCGTKVAPVTRLGNFRMTGMTQNQAPRFLTVAEVADLLRVSKMTVYRMVHAGDLPAVRVKRSFRVPLKAVEELSASNLENWMVGNEDEAVAQ